MYLHAELCAGPNCFDPPYGAVNHTRGAEGSAVVSDEKTKPAMVSVLARVLMKVTSRSTRVTRNLVKRLPKELTPKAVVPAPVKSGSYMSFNL